MVDVALGAALAGWVLLIMCGLPLVKGPLDRGP
jgi:hypothetical protein